MMDDELRLCISQSCELAGRGAAKEALDVLDRGLRAAAMARESRWSVLLARHAAVIAEHTGDIVRAVRYLELALQHKPDDVSALYGLADLYGRLGEAAKSDECFRRCLELSKAQRNQGMIELLAAKGFGPD